MAKELTMNSPNNQKAARAFAAALASAISQSVSEAIAAPWQMEVTETPEIPTRNAQPVQYRIHLDGAVQGECFLEFYEPQVTEVAARLPGAQPEAPLNEQAKRVASAIAAGMPVLATSLASEFGELSFKVDCVSGLAFGGMFVVALSVPEGPAAPILVYFDSQLLAALGARESDAASQTSGRRFNPSNLKLVMDVELNVSLRFGQRQLPLREVLELTSGSVVELDRMVDEPVELLLDGKVVARGEAVIVDGNYGLRITEVPQSIETHFLN
jgi:flagellar motor switch protein FliN/FliY